MNVLIAVPWDQETGGVASVVGHLAQSLVGQGHQVVFVHPAERRWPRRKVTKWGFPGYELNLRDPDSRGTARARAAYALTYPVTLLSLYGILRRHRIDIVNVHYPSAMFAYFIRLRKLLPQLRLVVSVHGTDLMSAASDRVLLDDSTGALLETADAVVSPSAGFARQCGSVLEPIGERLRVIHNGIDPAEFPERTDIRRTATLLTIASLDPWKGVDVLIRAVARLVTDHPEIRLVIAGEGPERAALEGMVRELRLEPAVEFLGSVDRIGVRDLLATCTVFVLASRSEPFGIVLTEALAAGAPIVATRVGGIPEILEEGAFGLLVPPDDDAALAQAIARLLRDPGERGRLRTAGPSRALTTFRWDLTGARYVALYEELLQSRAR